MFNRQDNLPIRWCGVDGYALELPPTCAGFLVRPWSPVLGPGELVIVASTGLPLVVSVLATPRQFCQRLACRVGSYRLAPVTASGRRAGESVATMEITPAMVARVRAPEVFAESASRLVAALFGVRLVEPASVSSAVAKREAIMEAATVEAFDRMCASLPAASTGAGRSS